MPLQAGIVGLPNVGKSTLFNAITSARAEAANYPFCTIDPNVGVVEVPDPRLDVLTALVKPKQTVSTTFEFVDIAGLVRGASKGEGLGNQFLQHIREVDAIVEVVRCFEDDDVVHVSNKVDPLDDIGVIHLELALADLAAVEKRLEKSVRLARTDKKIAAEVELLQRIKSALEKDQFARSLEYTDEERAILKGFQLLTAKPLLYVCNVSEAEAADPSKNPHLAAVRAHAAKEGTECVVISARLESEIAELDKAERPGFLASVGLDESGLDRLVHAAYRLLGLGTYFTAGEKEVRAWTFHLGWKAPQCAGVIHTDFVDKFIRAEVVSFDDLKAAGSMAAAREAGKLRIEGREYEMKDGDVCYFRIGA